MKKLLALLALCVAALTAQAQAPIELIVYSAAGNQSDTAARFFAPIIEKELGTKVIVVNKPGASGAIGMRYAVEKPATEDFIMVGNAGITLAKVLNKLPFDPVQAFEPLHGMSFGNAAIFVAADSPIKTASDIKSVYAKMGRVRVGSTGDLDDVTLRILEKTMAVPFDLVRYKKAEQMATDVTENRIDLTVASLGAGAYQALADAGKMRAVAVIDDTRSKALPTIPTLKEQGFSRVEGFRWTAFFVRSDMPADKKVKYAAAVEKAMRSPEAAAYEQLPGRPNLFLRSGSEIASIQKAELQLMSGLIQVQK